MSDNANIVGRWLKKSPDNYFLLELRDDGTVREVVSFQGLYFSVHRGTFNVQKDFLFISYLSSRHWRKSDSSRIILMLAQDYDTEPKLTRNRIMCLAGDTLELADHCVLKEDQWTEPSPWKNVFERLPDGAPLPS